LITAGSIYLHNAGALDRMRADPALLATWATTLAFVVIQLVLAWSQKPLKVKPREQAELDRLRVTVVIPCYNEDPQILDRTIVSLIHQTRLPDHIEVVDDGSTVDYSAVRDHWLAQPMPGVRFSWVRQRNAGKKHAQAVTFTSDRDADIFVTIDSDSALDRRAINEGLKPFADQRVVSVAGLETAINIDRNLLTRAIGHRSLVFQLFAMSAQSVARGSVLINPGAFSLYRAPLIRKIVPSYLGETFFGVPVTLGDDTALTLYALLHGRAVHQPTAVSLPVYPETIAHHLRQWTRWMRASTIRMLWRLRYLPVLSYGWIFTVYTIGSFLFSAAMTIAIPLVWPASEKLLLASIAAMVIWPLSISLRLATVRRSDQGVFNRLFGVALLPVAALWYVLVLRQIRFYGIATCWRQGWVTRQHVEVRLDGSPEPVTGRGPVAEAEAAAERRRGVPRAASDERRSADPRSVRDPRGVRAPRADRDPRFRGAEIARDPRVVREGDGARPPRAPRQVGNAPAARERLARQQAPWADPYTNGPQNGWQPWSAASDRGPGAYRGAGQIAARYRPAPSEPVADHGFDPYGYQDHRWAGENRTSRGYREDLDGQARGPQPPRDPRGSMPRPDRLAGTRPPYDPRVAPGADVSRGRYVPNSRDEQWVRDGYRAPRELTAQDLRLRPNGRPPADSRQGWAELEQRGRRDPHDQEGGYAKEYRQ
jgi:hyaluronan synthase